jgi:hypothetical protein
VLVADKAAIRIFVSYSHKDAGAKDKLLIHLAPLMNDSVSAFYDGDMDAGDVLHPTIARELRHAHIFIALLSPDYLASHYCWNIEYRRAMNRRARGTLRVVGAIVRPCGWKRTVAAGFKQLPADGKPVTDWRSADHAYQDVVEGIASVIKTLRKEQAGSIKSPRKAVKPVKSAGSPKLPPAKAKLTRPSPRSKKSRSGA